MPRSDDAFLDFGAEERMAKRGQTGKWKSGEWKRALEALASFLGIVTTHLTLSTHRSHKSQLCLWLPTVLRYSVLTETSCVPATSLAAVGLHLVTVSPSARRPCPWPLYARLQCLSLNHHSSRIFALSFERAQTTFTTHITWLSLGGFEADRHLKQRWLPFLSLSILAFHASRPS